MTTKNHKKHSDIARPSYGNFGRNEWAIIGTHCNMIKALSAEIIKALSPKYKFAYADAKHVDDSEDSLLSMHLKNGAVAEYTNDVDHHHFNYKSPLNQFQFR